MLVGSREKTSAADNLLAQNNRRFQRRCSRCRIAREFYAEKRGIADDHLVELDCPTEEEISREQYDATIVDPLREIFDKRQW